MAKFRVGRRTGRAILFVSTGHEYIVFPPESKNHRVQEYCDYLNQLPEHRDYSFKCKGELGGYGRCISQCDFCKDKYVNQKT